MKGMYGPGPFAAAPLDTCSNCHKELLVLLNGVLVCPACDRTEWWYGREKL